MACPPALLVAGGIVRDSQAGGMIRSEEVYDPAYGDEHTQLRGAET